MNQKKFMIVAGAAVLLLSAGVWLSMHRSNLQTDRGGGAVFADLQSALGEVEEIRLSRGDGSRTTLHRSADGWTVVERKYPADAARVRELALGLAGLRVVEQKTSDPANYAKLGVEAPDKPTAGSTLVEVVAGPKTWSLIVGKSADGRAVYVRKPAEAASALAQPFITADPDQKRWIDRLITDIPGANVHDIAVKPASGPGYVLTRADRNATDADPEPDSEGPHAGEPDVAQWTGRRTGGVPLRRRARIAGRRAPAATRHARPIAPSTARSSNSPGIAKATRLSSRSRRAAIRNSPRSFRNPRPRPRRPPARPRPLPFRQHRPSPAKVPDKTVETLGARAKGLEYEIPAYKYEAIFKKQEELLEPAPLAAKAAKKQ